jgi:Cu+-exporting ATPase
MASELPVPEDDARVVLSIGGMTCASCVAHVEKALRAVPGVSQADANLVTERATIAVSKNVPRSALVAAVVDAGYEVAPETEPLEPLTTDAADQADASEATTHDGRHDREVSAGDHAFFVALALSVPLLVLGMAHGLVPAAWMNVARSLQFALATAVLVGPGRRFFVGALAGLRHRTADMNTLVALGTGSAWLYSTFAVFAPSLFERSHGGMPDVYFEAAGAIATFVLLGKKLESRARKRLSDAVRALVALTPAIARRIEDDHDGHREVDVPLAAIRTGDRIVVRPGERVAIDAIVLEGHSSVDESMLTGESEPVEKNVGSALFGGTQNLSGAMVAKVSRVGRDTALARIIEAVEAAQGSKAPIARLADAVAAVFVPIVLGVAIVTLAVWLVLDPTSRGLSVALERFVAVLVIACPCAVGLATPAAVAVGTGRGAELGILFRGGEALEAASRIDTVLFDKTGTLTRGKPEVLSVVPSSGWTGAELLTLAASVEQRSEHPLARAVLAKAASEGAPLRAVTEFASASGFGVEAVVDGRRVRLGAADWLAAAGIPTATAHDDAERLARSAQTAVFVAVNDQLAGLLGIGDRPASEAKAVVAQLLGQGIDVAMVSGDREATARAVAAAVGIADVAAGVRPEGKAAIVRARQALGRRVAMVGDGINDAPAIATADVGIAVAGGTDIAVSTADVALLRGGLTTLPLAFALARATMRTIRENLFWAFVYNVIGIPIATGALHGLTGFQLSPVLASAAMSLSSVSVLANSLRLRRFGRNAV